MMQVQQSSSLSIAFLSSVVIVLCESTTVRSQHLTEQEDVVFSETTESSSSGGYSGYWWFCDSSECSGDSAIEQLPFLVGCISGPAEISAYECRCANLAAERHVTLWDFAVFQNHPFRICERVASVAQMPGLGYCPETGSIFRANVIETFDGTVLLVGTLLGEGDPSVDVCIYEDYPDCHVVVPFAPLVLTSQELSTLHTKLDAIPLTFPDCCDYAWDPCIIKYLSFGNRHLNDYCWGCSAGDDFRYRVNAVFQFLGHIINP